jgi:hypothetical protein
MIQNAGAKTSKWNCSFDKWVGILKLSGINKVRP